MLPDMRFRPPRRRTAAAVAVVVVACLGASGCSSHDGNRTEAGRGDTRTAQARPSQGVTPEPSKSAKPRRAQPEPTTAVQFVARARQAMAAEQGWTFALRGKESAVMEGQAPSGATYAATVDRTTTPVALRQAGDITTSKGEHKTERVYVVDGTGYVKNDTEAWKKGPLTDPVIAGDVEDPVAELDAFAAYAKSAKVLKLGEDDTRLQITASGWQLQAARSRPALKRAVRELEPALAQLRAAGVTATDSQVTLKSFTETWDLDAAREYRLTSHRYSFTFLVPFQGGKIAVAQELRADNRGVFTGRVSLPAEAK